MKEPWCAYVQFEIRDDKGNNVVVYVEEGEPGYYETTYTGDFEYVQSVAKSINESLGIDEAKMLDIVSSSLGAGSIERVPAYRDAIPGVTVFPGDQPNETIIPIGQTEDETPE